MANQRESETEVAPTPDDDYKKAWLVVAGDLATGYSFFILDDLSSTDEGLEFLQEWADNNDLDDSGTVDYVLINVIDQTNPYPWSESEEDAQLWRDHVIGGELDGLKANGEAVQPTDT